MTEITAYNKKGGVSFHSLTPRILSEEEIQKELIDWGVSQNERVEIKIWK